MALYRNVNLTGHLRGEVAKRGGVSYSRSQEPSGAPECIVGGTGRDCDERLREHSRRTQSRLGEPPKQNTGERRARLGVVAVK